MLYIKILNKHLTIYIHVHIYVYTCIYVYTYMQYLFIKYEMENKINNLFVDFWINKVSVNNNLTKEREE